MQLTWTRRAWMRDASLTTLALSAGCTGGDTEPTSTDTESGEAVALSKAVYVQLLGVGEARLRFETREEVALTVILTDPDGVETTFTPEQSASELTYEWNAIAEVDDIEGEGDVPGLHVLHTVGLSGLTAGTWQWTVRLGGGASVSGSFAADPGPGASVRIGWLADTMVANTDAPMATLASLAPDVVVHGGDLVYQSHPFDTWVETSRALAELTAMAPFANCVGNHEFEEMDEVEVMFDRLYQGQGDSGSGRHFAFTYGPVRFIVYDTESARYGYDAEVEGQDAWLEAELQRASADADIQVICVGMHRPMYTLSKYWVDNPAERDARHALFVTYGVDLVFCGHMHGYEHFEVDGITYIVDGGGGAILYNPVEGQDEVAEARPEEVDLQVHWEKSYGCSLLEVGADGSWTLTRHNAEEGTVTETISGPSR